MQPRLSWLMFTHACSPVTMSWLVSMVWKYPCWFCKRRHSCFWAEGSKIIDIVTEVQEVSRPSHLCAVIWALGAKYSGTPCIYVSGQRARRFAIRTCISWLCWRVLKLCCWFTFFISLLTLPCCKASKEMWIYTTRHYILHIIGHYIINMYSSLIQMRMDC